jgi:16S rRNA (guanine527-N7)-methyltransferase
MIKAMLTLLNEHIKTQALSRLHEGLAQLNLEATNLQLDQLLRYLGLLMQWNRVYNLTAVREPLDIVNLHFLDCMAMITRLHSYRAPTLPTKLLDVGAGAGLPGLIVAIFHPEWQVHLIDAVSKKAAFMRQVVGALSLRHVKIIHGRIESLHLSSDSVRYDVITSRAFASLKKFVSLSADSLAPDGFLAAMQGKEDSPSASGNDLADDWRLVVRDPLIVPGLFVERHLAVVKRI